ncbi:hypothetical protein [Curvivirga aplysinae]|uniref:hypothetical protein n=1 Tax=Curvivirga aplysinae TaxID=2529852 RepID=UPI0012BD5BD1|nr:hypothetical protein [Curvivirga aplysinae]MTI09052.1 hypothetical protein [Curvivirga aplysinae]
MMKKVGMSIAFLFSILTVCLWYQDGAWNYGEIPTKAVFKVVGFTFLACLCFWLQSKFRSKIN